MCTTKLAVRQDVGGCVFQMAVLQLVDADHQNRRVFAQHVEHAEGRCIYHPVGVLRGDQCDGPWHDQAGHQFVALVSGEGRKVNLHASVFLGACACGLKRSLAV